MEEAYERLILALEERHWWYRGRRRVLRAVLESLSIPDHGRLLDAGCGSGRNLLELRPFGEVTGIELSATSCALARERGIGEVVQGSIEAIPFADGSFDAAVALDVIEHVDDTAALRQLARVVRIAGLLVVTVPAYQWLWSSHDERNQHRRRYTRRTLLEATRVTGWEPIRTTYFNSFLLPGVVAVRMLERVRRSGAKKRSDFERTPAWANYLLEQPMRSEAAVIRAGASLPAGLSLLGVFRNSGLGPGRTVTGRDCGR